MTILKRWIAVLLSLVLVLGMVPVPVHTGAEEVSPGEMTLTETTVPETTAAEAVPVTEETETIAETQSQEAAAEPEETAALEETAQPELAITLVRVNPLYADVVDDAEWPVPALMTLGLNDSCANAEEIAEILRDAMVARQEVISVDYSIAEADYDDAEFSALLDEAVELAMAHTGEPTEGDYIQWQYRRWQCNANATGDGTYWHFTITYMLEYGTDAEQEAEMDTAVANLLAELRPSGSDYNKIRTVYDYMTANITYDYENLSDSSYFLKHTAYAALINKTAVCQGYAVLLYRLALEMGIDCRVITGTSDGEGHAWNIVELENKYYNLDSTWDAGEAEYDYFLRSDSNFPIHDRDEAYLTESFYAQYPMGTSDYVPSEEPEPTEPHVHSYTETVTAPTCTDQGYTTYTCDCGESYVDAYVDATGHSFGEWTVTKEATTETEGQQRRDCGKCDAYETQVIEKLPEETEPEEEYVASGVCGDDLTWTLSEDGVLTISGEGEMDDYPDIDYPWCDYVDQIKNVNIKPGATSVGGYAFYGFENLVEIDLPNTIVSIGERAFADCALITFEVPNGVTSIGEGVFSWSKLQTIYIPESVTYIANGAFAACSELYEIIVSSENTVYMSDDVGALYNKEQTTLINAPRNCSGIFTVPDSVNEIAECAFMYCDYTEINLPQGITCIEPGTFNGCYNLTEITIPESVTKIGGSGSIIWGIFENAFEDCWSLKWITFEGNAPEIAENTFSGVAAVAYYPFENKTWTKNVMQTYGGDITWIPDEKNFAEPDGACGDNAFWNYSEIEYTLSITGIGPMFDYEYVDKMATSNAPWIEYADNIKRVVIEDGITSIGDGAFTGCNIYQVEIPNSVTSIGNGAFCSTNLDTIDLPDSIVDIGESAFRSLFYLTDIVSLGSITEIEDLTFANCENLTQITIPSNVTRIGGYAFAWCYNLNDVSIPEGVTIIEDSVFSYCNKLESIIIPASVNSIHEYAFKSCSNLTHLVVNEKNTTYSSDNFGVLFNKDRTELYNALDSLSGEYIIPDSVAYIGRHAFRNYDVSTAKLTKIVVPASVNRIGNFAFASANLKEIVFHGSAPEFCSELGTKLHFRDVTATAYYPANNPTWTEDVRKDYGGTITWVAYGEEPEPTIPDETVPDEFDGKIFTVSGDLSISDHSQNEISTKFASIVEPTSVFAEKPSVTAPYAAGKLSDSLLENGLTTLNYYRYVTRLPQVQLDAELNDYAQHGAVVMAANDVLTHYPAQPADMEDAFYEKGYGATTTSNISWNMGYPAISSISVGLQGCLWDEDSSNISRLGHRRWLLNPRLLNVGFGYAQSADGGNYSVTKVFDSSGAVVNYDFVAFPASGNFPTNLFNGEVPWSVTLNPQRFKKPDVADLTVTITRKSDGKSWTMDANTGAPVSNANACLGIDFGGYGVSNCIIFSPGYNNVKTFSGVHTVEITGLTTWDGQEAKLCYEVNFFDVTDVEPEPTQPEETTAPTETTEPAHECEYVSTVFKPTCTEQGYTEYICAICGESYRDDYTDAIGHNWKKWRVTKGASTTEEGEAYRECGNCTDKDYTTLEKLTEEGQLAVVTTDGTGIRPNANAQGDLLGSYELGAIITVYEISGDWIRTGEGWVSVGSVDTEDITMSQEERNLRRCLEEGQTEVTVDDSFTLSKDLYIPENVYLNIQNGCTMTVPDGVTLDIGGLMGIWENSELKLADGGTLAFSNQDWAVIEVLGGTLDVSDGTCSGLQQNTVVILLNSTSVVKGLSKDMLYGSYYVNNMADVNNALAMAADYGYMQLDVTSSFDLTNSITIPENTLLSMYYETYEVAALNEVTVTNNGEIWVRNGNLMAFAEGSTLVNNGYVYVDGYSALMMFGDYYGNGDVEGYIISGTLAQNDLEEALKYAGADDVWVHSFHTTLERNMTVNVLFAMYRFGKLVVPDGVTLTMNAELALMPGAQIIVENGGKLVVNADVYSEGLVNIRSGGEIEINGKWDGNAPVYDHTHFYSKTVTKPTCTEQGFTTYTCSCGDSYVSDYVAALGHSYDDGKVTTKPGCETEGTRTYTCTCGHSYTESIPAAGHTYTAAVTKPTCTEEGFTTYTCDNCGSSYVDNLTDPTGHSFGDWYVTKEATTEAEGEERRDCEKCEAYETRAVEKAEIPTSGKCGENLTWELADGVLTISGTGEMEHYSYDWSNLTGTAPWFELREEITAVNIENGVTAIGCHAFAGCASLTSVTLPNSLTSIRYGAFENCTGLTEIILPDSLTSIEGNAFHSTGLTSVEIPKGVTSIASGVFWECYSLESVTLPEGVTSIDNLAFHICTSLKSIKLPDSLTYIGGKAFSGCESLTSLTIPGGVETYGFDAFAGCTSLTDVVVQEGVTAIGDAMFMDCFALKNVALPGSLTLIDDYAFARCKSLTEITIPANVMAVDDYAFRECESLKTVSFEGDAPAIGDNTFLNVVANAYYPADNATWTSDVMKDYGGDLTWIAEGGEDAHDGKLGDVNHDGKINAKDATLILQSSVGVLKPNAKFCEECAEVSGDGKLNAKDSTLILQVVVGLRDSFPAQK